MFRTNTIASAVLATSVLAAGIALPGAASAKDWIEKVEVSKDGIDVKPVEVSANMNGYTGIKSNNHRFLLRLYARATNGERIVAMKLGSFKGVLYFEGDGNLWSKSFQHRDVGAGTKRTVSINYDPTIGINKIRWNGSNPKTRCDLNLQQMMKQGMSRSQVLSQPREVKAYAYFELDAVAARKNKAENNKWNLGNTTNQRDGYAYEVRVLCHAGTAKVGG
jgi:hypothetical protein